MALYCCITGFSPLLKPMVQGPYLSITALIEGQPCSPLSHSCPLRKPFWLNARLPANLTGQAFGPAARVLGGVFTGHVASGEDATAQLPRVLRAVGVIHYHSADVLQYLAV